MAEQSLKDKTVKGTIWSAADAFLGQGVTFIVGLVLARLLSPEEYGLIGICLIFSVILNGIVDSGFSNALIRKNECNDDDYNTMFLTNLFISIVLFFLLFFTSPLISSFFNRDELTPLLRATGSILIINALSLTHTTILTKRIDFKTRTKASLISAILSGLIGIVMAYMGCGVWSLAGQLISKQLFYTLCLWFLVSWCPSFSFNIESFHYMWGFGWKLLLSGLLNNIWNQLYQVIIGKYYSPSTLGQYTRANQFAGIFSENLTVIIQRVSYPVLSAIRENQQRMVSAFRKLIRMTMFVTVICLFSLAGVSESLIICLIGPKWSEAATYLPLICITMSFYPLHAINLNMLQVIGRSDIFLYLEVAKKVIAIVPLVIGIFISVYWMLVASIVVGVISFFINSWYSGKRLGYTSWDQLRDIAPFYGLGIVLAISLASIQLFNLNCWFTLCLQILLGTTLIVCICRAFRMQEYTELKTIIINKLKNYKQENEFDI